MMKKIGVNTRSVRKDGPTVKNGASERTTKVITCPACGARLEKSCPNELACELSSATCPKCGAEVR